MSLKRSPRLFAVNAKGIDSEKAGAFIPSIQSPGIVRRTPLEEIIDFVEYR